ncbi:hypothetical protein L484_019543 [Morus notabilis]|uniref:Uncharacterized protein n=1 Tax=Morus notabilis TaxID=981085 RepID=W9R3I3_9ROSA|nr:hypothetical protein L484_019543 [Morus notabilis]
MGDGSGLGRQRRNSERVTGGSCFAMAGTRGLQSSIDGEGLAQSHGDKGKELRYEGVTCGSCFATTGMRRLQSSVDGGRVGSISRWQGKGTPI